MAPEPPRDRWQKPLDESLFLAVNEIGFVLVVIRDCKMDPSDPHSNSERLMLTRQNRSCNSLYVPVHKMGEKKHF